MIYASKHVSFNPVHQGAGFSSALKKTLRATRLCIVALCCFALMDSLFAAGGRKSNKVSREKNLGQIFTPEYLVCDILDISGYKSTRQILGKHIIDNSCGDGAFLTEVVLRYCIAAKKAKFTADKLKKDLESYIHGIELDKNAYHACLSNLNSLASSYSLSEVKWDVKNANTLDIADEYANKMDFVVGNPPYVRVHNLEDNFIRVKQYRFCSSGMTDLYLVFYEIGLAMLKDRGKLCYIAPSSWFNSIAGCNMRKFVKESGWLRSIIDLKHFQPFNATVYTAIVLFEKSQKETFSYKTYDESRTITNVAELDLKECYFDDAIYLGEQDAISDCRKIKTGRFPKLVEVKNGFATLADNVFIADKFPFDDMIIPVVKASTGKWRKAFYPYDRQGKPFTHQRIFSNPLLAQYLKERKQILLKGRSENENPDWYLYGRTQALKDVWSLKYSVNSVVRDISSIKMNKVNAGSGVYSGLYILTQTSEKDIRDALFSMEFIKYIQMLMKYKSGGYYTFSSKDLEQFLNYRLHKLRGGKITERTDDKQMTFDFQEETK